MSTENFLGGDSHPFLGVLIWKVAQASACKIPKSSYYLEQAEACATFQINTPPKTSSVVPERKDWFVDYRAATKRAYRKRENGIHSSPSSLPSPLRSMPRRRPSPTGTPVNVNSDPACAV